MPKPPRLPKQLVVDRIRSQLGNYERTPFQAPLAMALANPPGHKHWREMAKKDPEKWARAVNTLSKSAGFAEVKEVRKVSADPEKLVRELVARFGHTQAKVLVHAAGLPASLIPVVTIESHAEEVVSSA